MAKLRAAILAAGRGIRMGGAVPKTLIPLGDHEPTLGYLLDGLGRAGVADVLIVTGFKPEAVQEFASAHDEGLAVTYVRNTRYASWGNFHSVRIALDASPGMEVMVVNSDIVVVPDVFARVAGASGDLVLAVERRRRLDSEDMRVELKGSSVRGIGKHLSLAVSHGEFAGVSLVRPDAHRLYCDIASAWEWEATTDGYYEDIYAEMVGRVRARAVDVNAGEYAEVDTPADVEAAVRVVATHLESPATTPTGR